MIATAIIAGMITFMVSRVDNRNNEMKATVRRLSSLSRQLHSLSKLNNATYRLVLDLKTGIESVDKHSYWVEKSTQKFLRTEEASQGEVIDTSQMTDEEKAKIVSDFSPDPRVMKAPRELGGGLRFSEVELTHLDKSIVTGLAYIYFYPEGRMDEAAVHIKATDKLQWTMAFHPLTAKAEVATEHVALKQIREQ